MKKLLASLTASLAVAILTWSQLFGATLGIRPSNGRVILHWPNAQGSFVLEESASLGPAARWEPTGQIPQQVADQLEVSVAPSASARYYRLRGQAEQAAPVHIVQSSPANGESGVAVTRETILRLSGPLSSVAQVGQGAFRARFGGRDILSRVNLSADRRTLTLFYLEPLPSNARIHVTLEGDGIPDEQGRALDADGDGKPGGTALLEFETLSIASVANTAVIGRVFASELSSTPGGGFLNRPLANVTITVDGAEQSLRTVTDVNGNFRLQPVPAGRFFVQVDGRTAVGSSWPEGDYYPSVGKAWEAVAGRLDNLAGGNGEIYLPRVAAGTLQPVSTTQETVISFPPGVLARDPKLAGVTVTVPANSLFNDSGARGGRVGIAAVSPDRLPEPLPAGLKFPLVITVQTDGPSNFDVPAAVKFPNLPDPVTGAVLPPGAQSALYSFNHDTGRWELQGPMTVSADGRFVESNPGVGIRQPGWHGTTPLTTAQGPYDALPAPNPDPVVDALLHQFIETQSQSSTCAGSAGDLAQDILNIADAVQVVLVLKGGISQVQAAYSAGLIGSPEICAAVNLVELQRPAIQSLIARLRGTGPESSLDRIQKILSCVSNVISQLEGHCTSLQSSSPNAIPPSVSKVCAAIPRAYQVMDVLRDLGSYLANFDINAMYAELATIKAFIPCASASVAIAGRALMPAAADPILVQKLDQFAKRFSVFNGINDADWSFVGDFIDTSNDTHDAVAGATPYAYLLIEYGGVAQRVRANSFGRYQVFMASGLYYSVSGYDPDTGRCGRTWGKSSQAGLPTEIHGPPLGRCDSKDSDGDGLSDFAENVLGTNAAKADTDGDGISDGAEIAQGLDPLDPKPLPPGLRSIVRVAGSAMHVAAEGDLVSVAEGASGVEVFNVFNGLRPFVTGRIATSGEAAQSAISGRWIAVATSSGVEIGDLNDPADPVLRHTVPLQAGARCVVAANGVAYAGTGAGAIVSVELATGSPGMSLPVVENEQVMDLAIEGNHLYAVTDTRLQVVRIDGLRLSLEGSVELTEGANRLFVGAGIGYLAHNLGYDTFDLKNASAPALIVQNRPGTFGISHFVASSSGLGLALPERFPAELALFDARNPAVPGVRRGGFELSQRGFSLELHHGLAYLANGSLGLAVFNPAEIQKGDKPPAITLSASFSLTPAEAERNSNASMVATPTGGIEVKEVQFYLDGRLVGSDGSFPFQHHFRVPGTPGQGSFTIKAKALGTGGREASLPEITVRLLPDRTAPEVLATSPENEAERFEVLDSLKITFSEPLDPASLTGGKIKLRSAGKDEQVGTDDDVAVDGLMVDYAPGGLGAVVRFSSGGLPSGNYRGTVSAGIRDASANVLANDYHWSFRVQDSTSPRIVSMTPEAEAFARGEIRRVEAVFSEPLSKGAMVLRHGGVDGYPGTVDDVVVPGTVLQWSQDRTRLSLSLQTALTPQHYVVEVVDAADLSGNELQQEPWEFVVPVLTTLVGRVQPPAGIPMSGAEIAISGSDKRVQVASDGGFRLERVELDPLVRPAVSVTMTNSGRYFEGRTIRVASRHGGTTDVGNVPLRESCEPRFARGLFPSLGPEGLVSSLVQFNDGSGSALYAALNRTDNLVEPRTPFAVQRWDGEDWRAVGGRFAGFGGASPPADLKLAVYDEGRGPVLFAGGTMETIDGVRVDGVARWNRNAWEPVGGGLSHLAKGFITVSAMAVHNDGSGPALYVSGSFNKAGGVPALNIAKWDGKNWSELGSGLGQPIAAGFGAVKSMVSYQGELYVGGNLGTAGGLNVGLIARWNGRTWSPVGGGLQSDTSFGVRSMAVFNDELYAAGSLSQAGGIPVLGVARWNGTRWAAVGAGLLAEGRASAGEVQSLAVATFDQKTALYASGAIFYSGTNKVEGFAKWDGNQWSSAAGAGSSAFGMHDLLPFEDASGPGLIAASEQFFLGPLTAGGNPGKLFPGKNVARWDGSRWMPLGAGLGGPVEALGEAGTGIVKDLYAGGDFVFAGPREVNNVARWDGAKWMPLGSGVQGKVSAIAEYGPPGAVASVYVAGQFQKAGLVPAVGIARWDGAQWSAVGDRLIYQVGRQEAEVFTTAMKVFDDGSGNALYVAGFFNKVGTLSVPGVARWNGSNWSALGSGLDGSIYSFAVFKDGSGSALFAGGQFAIVEGSRRQECSVAKWNGTRWMAIGESSRALLDQFVFSLVVHDDGAGPALYAGGAFGGVQGTQRRLRSVTKWTGSDWVPLARGPSGGFGTVRAMGSFDDGFGARLYVAGSFGSAAPSSVSGVAQWDGNVWTGLAGGLEGANGENSVNAVLIHDDGQGRGVYFGGAFVRSAGKSPFVSNRMAKWYRSSVPCPPGP